MAGGEGACKVIISGALCASLGIRLSFKLPNGVLSVGPHFILNLFDYVHPKLQFLHLIIVHDFINFLLDASFKEDLVHSSLNMFTNGTRILV